MSSVFTVLLLASLAGLAWGLIAPSHMAKITKVSRPVTRKHTGLIFGCLAILFLILAGITAPQQPKVQKVNLTTQQTQSQPDNVTTKQGTSTQAIPFTTINQNDSDLAKGQTQIVQTGKDGVKTLTYTTTYTNGLQTDQQLIKSVTTTQPVNQIVDVGTYVAPVTPTVSTPTTSDMGCTNGTYVNSAGNTVCRPETSSTVPAGATAQCVDGTYSFSQSHSGTCSHHGGVAKWL